jgi:hypothetical protein
MEKNRSSPASAAYDAPDLNSHPWIKSARTRMLAVLAL